MLIFGKLPCVLTGYERIFGGSNIALVPLCRVFLWGRIPGEHAASSRQWDFRVCFPESFRLATRGRLILLNSQCFMGTLQPCRRLPAHLSCRQLQSAQHPPRARPRGRHLDYVADACPHIRTVARRAVKPLCKQILILNGWRRERDSNPRYPARHIHHERANSSSGWMSPLSAARWASKYRARASPCVMRSLEPHVNAGPPSFIMSRSAMRRACLPLPFGKG